MFSVGLVPVGNTIDWLQDNLAQRLSAFLQFAFGESEESGENRIV
jgi:hypothetical protein